jgi:hypothetical protein
LTAWLRLNWRRLWGQGRLLLLRWLVLRPLLLLVGDVTSLLLPRAAARGRWQTNLALKKIDFDITLKEKRKFLKSNKNKRSF